MAAKSFWGGLSSGFSNFADGVSDLFNVGSTISTSSNINEDDVLKTKSALNAVGSYKVPNFGITDIPDQGMIDGLKSFQANNGLKVDGVMKPGGPTEKALGQNLANQGISSNQLLEKSNADLEARNVKEMNDKSTAYVDFNTGEVNPVPKEENKPKATTPKRPKIDPLASVEDPLANAPEPKVDTKKAWDDFYKHQAEKKQKAQQASQVSPEQNNQLVMAALKTLMEDERYPKDPDYVKHVQGQFAKAYPGESKYDETGKMMQPQAVIQPSEVEAYGPTQEQANEFEYQVSDGKLETDDTISAQSVKAQSVKTQSKQVNNFKKYRENLAPREGGIANRPDDVDPGGVTKKGMSQKELNRLRELPEWKHLPESSLDLTDQQIDDVFEKEYYLRSNLDKLDQIPGLLETSPKFVEQLFDSNILHGIDNPGKWLQQAIMEEAGIDLRVKNPKTGRLEYDGIIGPATRKAVTDALKAGKIKTIHNRISQMRMDYAKRQPNFKGNPGWVDRIKSFHQE